jgi:Tol biopolymer transport system component
MPSDTHDDIRSLLLDAASGLPALAPAPLRTIRRARRRMLGTLSVAAIVVGLLVGVGVTLVDPPSHPVPVKEPQKSGAWIVDLATGTSTRLEGPPRDASWFDASRDGSTIAFSASRAPAGLSRPAQIYLMAPNGTNVRKVTNDPYEASEPTLSQDGTQLAYRGFGDSTNRNLFLMDESGHVTQVTHGRKDVSVFGWSPDGSRILYSVWVRTVPPRDAGPNGRGQLRVLDVGTGKVMRLAGGHRIAADFGTWSPDGLLIAFMSGYEWANEDYEWANEDFGFQPAAIWVMDADGTHKRQVLPLDMPAFDLAWSPDGTSIAFSASDANGFSTYVFDVNTHEVRRVATGYSPTWIDDHTIIVQIGIRRE